MKDSTSLEIVLANLKTQLGFPVIVGKRNSANTGTYITVVVPHFELGRNFASVVYRCTGNPACDPDGHPAVSATSEIPHSSEQGQLTLVQLLVFDTYTRKN